MSSLLESSSTINQQSRTQVILDLLKGGREFRPAQVEMALLVERGIREGVPVLVEASTGTGKTAAYLISAIRSGRRVIISTANRALQDQIHQKDVPFLQEHVQPFGAARIKGVGNYVCRDRLHETRKDLAMYEAFPELEPLVAAVQADSPFSGDFETLPFSVSSSLRSRINGNRDECAWAKCDFFDQCYVRKMRDTALSAQVVIVNHTLLMLDAATDGAILPHDEGEAEILVIDEAHHLAQEAISVSTISLRPTQLASLLQLRLVKELTPSQLLFEIERVGALVWARVEGTPLGAKTKIPFTETMHEAAVLVKKVQELERVLRKRRPAQQTDKEAVLYDKLLKRIGNLAQNIEVVFDVDNDAFVHYIEHVQAAGHRRQFLWQVSAAPLSVAAFLKEKVFDKAPCVILTSATLATIGPHPTRPEEAGKPNFAYFRREIGLSYADFPHVLERILPLTFDYRANTLLYIPRTLPEPVYGTGAHIEAYHAALADEMRKLVLASHGRAFLLFSSTRMLGEVYRRIAHTLPFPVVSQQEDMNRTEMLRCFRSEGGSVLFGLKSFWEGVDIAGDSLSLVVIDKLPFDPPDDPVHEARVAVMKAAGKNPFGEYILPRAVLQLKQGVGRLVRTPTDRGVMAILDSRLVTKGYGRQVLQALPPSRRVTTIAEVEQFFAPNNSVENSDHA